MRGLAFWGFFKRVLEGVMNRIGKRMEVMYDDEVKWLFIGEEVVGS